MMYRLPTIPISATESQDLWAKEWNTLADKVVKFFPGYRISGMDPGVLLVSDEGYGNTISLSLHACFSLVGYGR